MNIDRTSIRTEDFDDLTAWERRLGFDAEKTQLTRGQGSYRSVVLTVGDLVVWRYRTSHKLFHEYSPPRGTVEFMFGEAPESIAWNGLELSQRTLLVQRGGQSFWGTTPADLRVYGFILPETVVLEWGLITAAFLVQAASPRFAVSPATDPIVEVFLRRVDSILANDGMPAWQTHEEIVSGLQRVLDVCIRRELEPRAVGKSDLIHRACEQIASRVKEPTTAHEVARSLHVSRRVLERGFRDVLGVSPYQFILVQKLHAARRLLKLGKLSVLDACMLHGFDNPGRFAGMYARHFGELPSATARHSTQRRLAGRRLRSSR